jgi:hypothetical protein
MAIKTSGELRQVRIKKEKPRPFKVEITLDEIRVIHFALSLLPSQSPAIGQSTALSKFSAYLKKFAVLNRPRGELQ